MVKEAKPDVKDEVRLDSTELLTVGMAVVFAFLSGLIATRLSIAVGRRLGLVVKPRLFGRSQSPITFLGGPALAITSIATFFVFGDSNQLVRKSCLREWRSWYWASWTTGFQIEMA